MIELRWLERGFVSPDGGTKITLPRVLQYRTGAVGVEMDYDADKLRSRTFWSDWIDVPTVREAE